jgi:DNA helicase HerA-like ATPase
MLADKEGKRNAFKFKKSDLKPFERITIIGKIGSGKSVLTNEILEYMSKKTLVVLIDTKREYSHIPNFELDNLKADKGLFRIYELEYKGYKIRDFQQIVEVISVLLFERGFTDKENKVQGRSSILAVEELGNVIKKHGRLYDVMPEYAVLIQQGRSRDVGFIGTTQRPQEIHTTILSESQHIVCFDLTSTHDLEAMKGYFEREWIDELGKHQFLHLNYSKNQIKRHFKLYLSTDKMKFYKSIFGRSY